MLDASSVIGLCATVILTLNLLLGMLLGTAYKKSVIWKKLPACFKKFKLIQLHNWTAYIALVLVLLHPALLLFDADTKFHLADILFPLQAPHQKFWVMFGTIALYALVLVIITSQKKIRRKIHFRVWKNIHLISYGTALLFCLHGVFLDPQLKDSPTDFFDGEKLISELCLLALTAAAIVRYRYYLRNKRITVVP